MKAFSVRENYLFNQLKWGYNKFATAGSTVVENTSPSTNDNQSYPESESESESETHMLNEKIDKEYHDDDDDEDNEYDSLLKSKISPEISYNTDLEKNGNADTTKPSRNSNIKGNKNLKNPKITIFLAIFLIFTCLHLLISAFFDLGSCQPFSMKKHAHDHAHAPSHAHPHGHGRHHGSPPPQHRRNFLHQLATDSKLNNFNLLFNDNNHTEASEVFEISLPKLNYGEPQYKQELLNYSFANSWGHPAIVDYVAPPSNINFTQVILGLSTTVGGVQYDRLAHIYLDGASIWRTSTIEPSGTLSHSYSEKDVTAYSKLFKHDV
ncbi:unnamed protein product [[Candida] boidinii]|nr:unnamed protein product [[Candida] boidinii]